MNLKDYLKTFFNSLAEFSAGGTGRTAISFSSLEQKGGQWHSVESEVAPCCAGQGVPQKALQVGSSSRAWRNGRVISLHFLFLPSHPTPKGTSLSRFFLHRFSFLDVKSGEGKLLSCSRATAPIASGLSCVIAMEKTESRRTRWVCKALRGSHTSQSADKKMEGNKQEA